MNRYIFFTCSDPNSRNARFKMERSSNSAQKYIYEKL
jgi:hypothetical protein